jgi:hypothetical protein
MSESRHALAHQLRWLGPAAAVATVLALVATTPAASAEPGRRTEQPAAAVQTMVPPYYVALTTTRPVTDFKMRGIDVINWEKLLGKANIVATVRATRTGRVLARIRPPAPYLNFVAVSGAANDRTFVLVARGHGESFVSAPERLYLLRINPVATEAAGRAQLTALPASYTSGSQDVAAMALAPNGRSLAVVVGLKLDIFNLATGTSRTSAVTVTGLLLQHILPGTFGLGWGLDSRSLALVPSSNAGGHGPRLQRLSAPGGKLRQFGKPITIHVTGVAVRQSAVTDMTPDGRTVFVSYIFTRRTNAWIRLTRFSPRTGRFRTVNTPKIENDGHGTGYGYPVMLPDEVFWTNSTGRLAIVGYARPGQTGGIYDGTTYTAIPWPTSLLGAAW